MAEQVLQRDPDNLKQLKERYVGLRELGDAAASQALQVVTAADPGWAAPEVYNHTSQLYSNGQVEAARVALRQLLDLLPDYPPAHYLIGLCYDRERDLDSARSHLVRFLELDPQSDEAEAARLILTSRDYSLSFD
jgi:tetratricopeptide (TPR) repeat protein